MLKPISEIELKILLLLEEDGRFSDQSLANSSGIAIDEVSKIRKELEKEGIILKYKAIIDREKIESNEVIALIQVNVTPHQGSGFDDIADKICRFKEVNTCILVSGSFDLLVEVSGPSLRDVAFFVADKLATIKDIEKTQTNFLLKRYKQSGDAFTTKQKTHRGSFVV